MAPVEDNAQPASDAELITRVRAGDRAAFGELYQRHAGAASALSRQFARSASEADDLVSEAFARVLDGLLAGKGPDTAFRAYLFTTLRNTAYDRTRKDSRLQFTDDIESHDVAVEGDDPVIADLENGLVGKAFAGLPERWQAVLWHTQVEGQSATEVGVLLGMAPNAVSSLAFRAREGLREAYLQAHLAESAADQCRYTIERLGAWTRGGLSKREKAQVDAHLATCDRCTALAAELSEINSGLRGLLAPLLLGGAAAGYIANLGPVAPLVQLGVLAAGTAAGGSAAGGTAAGGSAAGGTAAGAAGGHAAASHLAAAVAKVGSWGPGAAIAGVGIAAAALVAGVVITLTGSKSPPASDPGARVAAVTTGNTGAAKAGNVLPGAAGGSGPVTGSATIAITAASPPPPTPGATRTSATTNTTVPASTTPSRVTSPTSVSARTPITVPVSGTAFAATNPTTGTRNSVGATDTGIATAAGTPTGTRTTPTIATSPTAPTTPTTPTTPTSKITTSSPTTPATPTAPTTPTTIPPLPADLAVSGPTVTGVVAGATASISLVVTNRGGTASGDSQRLGLQVPPGVTVGTVSTAPAAPALRSATAFSMAGSSTCPQSGGEITCPIPAIGPGAAMTVTVTLDIAVDAADGNLLVTLNGQPIPSGTFPLTVPSGFASVALVSEFALGRGAVNRVKLTAVLEAGVTDAGRITVGGPNLSVIGAGAGCTVSQGTVSCLSAALVDGVTLDIMVDPAAAGDLTVTATDQRDRTVAVSPTPNVSTNALGGYESVLLTGHVLRAGSTDTVTITGRALNLGVSDPGPISIPIALAGGITLVTDPAGLPAGCVANGAAVVCTPTNGGSLEFTLPVRIASDATGPQTLGQVKLPTGSADLTTSEALTVDPIRGGYDGIELTSSRPLTAGTMGTLTLTGTPGATVDRPGPITLPGQLSKSLLITAAQGCARTLDTFVCGPDGRGVVSASLTVAVLPGGSAADSAVADAVLAGGRRLAVGGTRLISARAPGDLISLTGPFGGTMAGAATLRCATVGVVYRGACPGGLSPVVPSSATVTIPVGAQIISAELTWAATAPRAGRASTLDTVAVSIDGSAPVLVRGVRPAGIAADSTGENAAVTGQMFARVDATAGRSLLAGAAPGVHTVSLSDLAARRKGFGTSPMGAWSITVIWTTGSGTSSTVTAGNRGQFNRPEAGSAASTEIAPTGAPVVALWQTIWAPDPWGVKALKIGNITVSSDITGRHHNLVDGFELLHPAIGVRGLTGPVTLVNAHDPGDRALADGLWVGPTLLIRSTG